MAAFHSFIQPPKEAEADIPVESIAGETVVVFEGIPLLSGIYCPCVIVTPTTKCNAGRPRAVTVINRIPLRNCTTLGNFSTWKILSIRYLLTCILYSPRRYSHGAAPYSTNVSIAIRYNFSPLHEVRWHLPNASWSYLPSLF